jgi:hypothetical protein
VLSLFQTIRALNNNDVSESKPVLAYYAPGADTAVELNYWGKEASPGVMAGWVITSSTYVRQLNPTVPALAPTRADDYANLFPAAGLSPLFLHVTQTKFCANDGTGLGSRLINATGDDKEFGPGFYTMSTDSFASGDCKRVADKWFSKPGQTWSVIGLQIQKQPNYWGAFLSDAGGNDVADLAYYLTHIHNHPSSGTDVPNATDIAAIERINLRGKVLIFPNDDSRVRVSSSSSLSASDVSNTQGANLPGDPWAVIGPQRPDCMLGARQVAWRAGLGLWLMNSALRFHVYKDS